ncbi:glycine-rich RNA-binding protein 4, mitochondrial-like [Cornus florida]|uniref:glycine-rich RNA-binding protein 4, mitochondrial-like n=1 Tax=Cornus florida TaxID=4283 RepID=UPI00289DA142|nr:glycine-rich RNA-binding protein 4, mitochondrial-like [Cornus florida]XP_059651191.1 glycine-rich RNA-binding protein 4, mitochondrial-like [Cornus florida]XP_059651199.1 glycine-rich RNA-binding protein 4, mitochondrial-like [Cornus florida]
MAFCNRFGGVLRQTISQNSAVNGPVPMASMINCIRCMSSKLFVGGLSWATDDMALKDAFSSFGDVTEARVIVDRESGRSRGFGFVHFTSEESANSAMTAMDGQDLNGRSIRVTYATERQSGGGGGGGGYRGGGGGGGYGNDGF